MQKGPPRRRRARPVADAPIDALLARAEDLAKGWLLALIEDLPLDDAPEIQTADLVRDGPRMCAAIVRALADDEDLRRLQAGGSLEPLAAQAGELAGARAGDAEATARALDALFAVIWSGIHSELADPDAERVSELAERLALVGEVVRTAALRRSVGETPRLRIAPVGQAPAGQPTAGRDEPAGGREGGQVEPLRGRGRADTEPPDLAWIGALETEVGRSERSGSPLSLLLIELDDADRIVAVESPPEVAATFDRFAQAVRSAVRREDILACESDTRAWIIARDTGRRGARALGTRVVDSVKAAPPWRGAPMSVSVGLAVLGENGRDTDALIRAAEQTKYAAAASGTGVDASSRGGAEEPAS